MDEYSSSIPITRAMIEDDTYRNYMPDASTAFAYNFLAQAFFGSPTTKENKMEKYKLNQTEKACISLMQNNGETLGTMTLAILEGSNYLTSSNSIEYYTNIQRVRKAIQKYIGGEDD